MRPFLRWFLFLACLAVFGAVMVWISGRSLELEAQRRVAAEEAQVQEKVRLALWRMDALASALLIRENARPAHHYQAFYAPDDLYASATRSIPKGEVVMPSPLFGVLPDLVHLHFEVAAEQASSPQAPVGTQQEIAAGWYASSPVTASAAAKLKEMEALLQKHPEVKAAPALSPTPASRTVPAPAVSEAKKAPAGKELQAWSNAQEQTQRAQILDRNLTSESAELAKQPMKKQPARAVVPPSIASRSASPLDKVKEQYSAGGSGSSDSPPAPRQAMPALAGDLKAVWAGAELLLVRQARLDGISRLQGVWLDWAKLKTQLLDTARDLLPEADLVALSPAAARTNADALVTLPVKLLTGRVPVGTVDFGSALKPALVLAWVCLAAAALAIAFVLHRAVLLSERRGAFVSAVTHELRTPLTTFRLYSEMLADDMVPDPSRRREYLQTLCDESTRLMHLVENVLAFSRIERGRTAARLESLSVGELMRRIEPRLRQRTDQVGLKLKTDLDPAAAELSVKVDALAVEQILFNLADNACKYAAPDCEPAELHFRAAAEGRWVCLAIRDFGPGLCKQARKKLFQAFAKSATEAAHSAPGVGLGLALSRRLARELGGRLDYQPSEERGACFRLTLPKAD